MPVHAIIPPDATIAGGVNLGGTVYTVRHNQLSGNTEGKRRKLVERLQDVLENRIKTTDLPLEDSEHPDHADNAGLNYNTYSDPYRRPDDSLIWEKAFYYRKNAGNIWLVHRPVGCDIVLVMENDPTLGSEDRYSLVLQVLN